MMGKWGVLKIRLFFFFKQKTAYEIYQCNWSSDVCSSDLPSAPRRRVVVSVIDTIRGSGLHPPQEYEEQHDGDRKSVV